MDKGKIIGPIVVVGVIAVVMLVRYESARDGQKERFYDEIRQFDRFETHRQLFTEVIEREHESVYRRSIRTTGSRRMRYRQLETGDYRSAMYGHLIRALQDAGHEADVIALDRFRSRSGS